MSVERLNFGETECPTIKPWMRKCNQECSCRCILNHRRLSKVKHFEKVTVCQLNKAIKDEEPLCGEERLHNKVNDCESHWLL